MSKKVFSVAVILVMIVSCLCVNANVYADTEDTTTTILINAPKYDPIHPGTKLAKTLKNAWATISVIVQILSVGCVAFAGIRYMYASADQKADIKQGLMYLAIGATLVFCATTIMQFVVTSGNEILNQ